ncbi:LAMI_0D05138g1_1 [Lachancea mirantina]|uniref:Dol-P-Man:Man(5)GlcNAc(2)-PP-Dol alpha-1,3-mannosyltransferase n=1 Tax=Lachancea mirantina TaxID=1230905 RepID=A0A1G4JAY5_9SACH|nr:LAMI_0D05138g1_1 [Lachancea mirantina]
MVMTDPETIEPVESITKKPATEAFDEKMPERPPINIWQDFTDALRYLIFQPEANHIVMPLVVLAESIALKWIIANVAYTEIDYRAYMEQIWMVKDGERDYSLIEGGTGPLVYPAGHVAIYKIMDRFTSGMDNLEAGQTIFRYLYIATLCLQMVCYVLLGLPPWCVVLASLSKRLHSIYVLRLFNDCFETLFAISTVMLLLISARFRSRMACFAASVAYGVAVSIKMNALLYLPAVVLCIFQLTQGSFLETGACLALVEAWQIYVAREFLAEHANQYWPTAFDFGRKFMYKWSINWQMLEEDAFQHPLFHHSLLAAHLLVLIVFALTRFSNFAQLRAAVSAPLHPFSRSLPHTFPTTQSIGYTLLMTNFVGIFFARSLHYQFLSWYQWTLPAIIHWSGIPVYLGVPWFFLHEFCWNSYPPNELASTLLFTLNAVLLTLAYLNVSSPVSAQKKTA